MNLNRLKLQAGAAALVAVFVLGTAGAVRVTTERKAQAVRAERQQSAAQARAIMDQMYATYAAMKSFKCSVTSVEDAGTKQNAFYEIEYPNKIRFSRVASDAGGRSGQAVIISDGSNLYITCTEANGPGGSGLVDRYVKSLLKGSVDPSVFATFGGLGSWGVEPHAGMPDVALGLRRHNPYSQTLDPIYSLGPPTVLSLPSQPGPLLFDVVIAHLPYRDGIKGIEWQGAEEVITYYIGHRDHLLYKLTATDKVTPTGWNTRTETINGNEVNPKLPASDFVFAPAPGSHEVEDTSDLFPGGKG